MITMGIDAGVDGGVAIIDNLSGLVFVDRLKTHYKNGLIQMPALIKLIDLHNVSHVVVEEPLRVLKNGAVEMWRNIGRLETGLNAQTITVREWHGAIMPFVSNWSIDEANDAGWKYKRHATKIKSVAYAVKQLDYELPWVGGRNRRPHDGCADAVCIAVAYNRLYGQ